jgi:CubicO group peptidase (beta-lactamase class C family)
MKNYLLVLSAAWLIAAGTGTLGAQQLDRASLDAYVQKAIKDWEVPGLALAVIRDDSVVVAEGYGVRTLGSAEPVDAQTLFAIASTTKAMTVACLGMLVDDKKLDWDDPVTKHLVGFQLADPYVTRELTVRDLLTHRVGLSRGDQLWWRSPYGRKEILDRVRYLKPSWSFRSRYGYQNIMFLAAGQVVEAVSETTWDDFITTRLFDPLGMRSTLSGYRKLTSQDNVATPHLFTNGKAKAIEWVDIDNIGPAGSVISNVTDMAQWVRLQLGQGEINGRRLLSRAVIEEMHTPQMVIRLDSLTRAQRPSTHFMAYGLGWFLYDYLGTKIVTHDGAIHGMRARVAMIPERNIGLVILVNSSRTPIHTSLMFWILDRLLGAPERDWSEELLTERKANEEKWEAAEQEQQEKRVKGTSPSHAAEAYAGTYQNALYGDFVVAVRDGRLHATFYPGYEGELSHWQYDTYQIIWTDTSLGKDLLTFQMNARGDITEVVWDGFETFKRQKP